VGLTKQQSDAVNINGKSVIVTAAAGSGKTRVLVERLIRLICDDKNPVSVKNIAVVTFTNEAAENMKNRLLAAVGERIASEPRNLRLRREAALIPAADICTIDSFALRLTRENVEKTPLADGFSVLEPGRADMLFAAAVTDVFEDWYKNRKSDIVFLSDIFAGKDRNDKNLREQLGRFYRFLRAKPFYQDFLHESSDYYSRPVDPKNDKFIKICKENAAAKLEFAKELAAYIEAKAQAAGLFRAAEFFANEKNNITAAYETAAGGSSPDAVLEAVTVELKFAAYRAKDDEKIFAEEIKPLREICKKAVSECADDLFSLCETEEDFRHNAKATALIADIISEIDTAYSEAKRAINAVDYADYIHFALDILCRFDNGEIFRTETAKAIAAKTDIIMIDEYQDSNDIQDLIFKLISKAPDLPDNFRINNNLFTVGDVKQSIYGFRSANPRIFTDTLKNKAGNPYLEKISLSSNFRSRVEVIDFVNAVMSPLMTENTFDRLHYDDDRLICGADFPDDGKNRKTEIVIANDDLTEAEAAALRIKTLIESGFPVTVGGNSRPCEPRDFVILMRSIKNTAGEYERALEKYGLRAVSESAEAYLKSYEVTVLLNLLRFLDNPQNDIPAVSVMMSPMFGFTASEMAEIRLFEKSFDRAKDSENDGEKQRISFYSLVLYGEKNAAAALREKISGFIDATSKLRKLSYAKPLPAFIRYIYDSTDLPSAVRARFVRGERKKANLNLLIKYAGDFAGFSFSGISGFVRYVENIIENGGDFEKAKAISPADNVVRIMSIHKSKGLEFPFVFLCGSDAAKNSAAENPPLERHSLLGFAVGYQNRETLKKYETLPQHALRLLNKNESRAERLRLLYVALTRAKERLFITATKKSYDKFEEIKPLLELPENTRGVVFAKNDSLFRLMMSALFISSENAENLYEIFPISPEKAEEKAAETAVLPPPSAAQKLFERLIAAQKSAESANAADNRPARLSVTEINALKNPAVYPLRSAVPDRNASRISAAGRGTAMHRFMQFCDFSLAAADIKKESQRLFAEKLLSEKDVENLEFDKLNAFFESELYKERLSKSLGIKREIEIYAKISDIPLDESIKIEYNISGSSFLQGVADLVFLESGGLVLLDYKTNRRYGQKREEFCTHLRELYSLQIALYAAALEAITGKTVKEKYIWAFDIGESIKMQ
jgi:ATP-dependent helicase/nuclease subunit A